MTPRTIVIAGNGTSVLDYNLPPGVYQYVQAVLANIDNTAGAAIRPTLRVKEQTGTVIATTRPAESIPAGGSGSTTWALRLSDSSAATGSAGIVYDLEPQSGGFLFSDTTTGTTGSGYGTEIIDTSGAGVHIMSDYGGGAGNMLIENNGDAGTIVQDAGSSGLILLAYGGPALLEGTAVAIVSTDLASPGVTITLAGGGTNDLTVNDSLGNPIFRVAQNGDLHGLTGKALVFDL